MHPAFFLKSHFVSVISDNEQTIRVIRQPVHANANRAIKTATALRFRFLSASLHRLKGRFTQDAGVQRRAGVWQTIQI